jgi:hypothetical protein
MTWHGLPQRKIVAMSENDEEKYRHLSTVNLAKMKDDPEAQEMLQGRLEHEKMADELGRAMLESIKKRPPVH